jgi:competence protein ComEC
LLLPAGRAPPLGARLSFIATVELPRGPEHGFDERTWLRRHGVHVVLRADRWRVVGHRGGFRGFADRLHARIAAPLLRVRGERGALLVGVVLGEDQGLAEELRTRFRASGLYHLLAVSGQNVAFVAGGALALVWLLGGTRLVGQLAALAAIGGYVFAVGPQPSVLRAGIVGALASLAWLAARQSDRWHFLLLAAVVLLALNPYAVYDPGFQLSFAAVVAIFLFVPRLTRTLEGYPLPAKLSSAIAVSTACGVATAPILWLQFGAIPIVAVPANAVVEPVMPVLLGLGLLAALVDQVAHGPATLLAQLGGFCGAYVAACARFFGGLPFAQVQSTVGLLALAAVALVVAAWVWRRRADAYAWRRWLRR